jgi:NTE family protein
MKRMLIHSIADDEMMRTLTVNSKLNADWEFLTHLRDVGHARAGRWLEENFDRVGKETTVDFATYL